jgi:hypothetical protein
MSNNVIKSTDVNVSSTSESDDDAGLDDGAVGGQDSETPPAKKVAAKRSAPKKQSPNQKKIDTKFIYFDSGSAYVTKGGFRFSPENRIYELPIDEADHLLNFDNFRIPNQIEMEQYYKENT